MTSKTSLGMHWQRLQPYSLISRLLPPVRARSLDAFGPNRFAMMSPTSGVGPMPSTASSSMRRKHRRALKISRSQWISLCQSDLASIRRYPSAQSLTRLPRTWTLWEFFCARTLLPRAQKPYMQRTSASEDLGRQSASSSATHATFADSNTARPLFACLRKSQV